MEEKVTKALGQAKVAAAHAAAAAVKVALKGDEKMNEPADSATKKDNH